MTLKPIAGRKDIWRVNVSRDIGLRMRAWAKKNRFTAESCMETAIEEFLAKRGYK